MATTAAQKMKIKEGFTLLTLNAPTDFKKKMGSLPEGITITASGKKYNQVHWFVMNKAQIE